VLQAAARSRPCLTCSFHLAHLLPDAQLSIYPDSGHDGLFQHHDLFVTQALDFLRD
jgi:pimeloyl-ACP methyl ester carboxylesterase